MLTTVKISVMALIATVALPPYSHEPAMMTELASSQAASAIPVSRDLLRQPDAEPIATSAQATSDAAVLEQPLPQARISDRLTPAPALPAKLPLGIGDSLKISFFETINMASDGSSGAGEDAAEPRGALRTFYQRMDLSGDYAVEQDGFISIPLLGRFEVEGRALGDVRADLTASFTTVIGRNANIDVKILERAPVYVVGSVKNPGAYKYAPGMFVLQAIALAGGLDRGGENLSGMIEGAREVERLRIASLQVQQLLARRARLEAERIGVSALPVPDDTVTALRTSDEATPGAQAAVQLAKMSRDPTAATFIATESTILRADQAQRRQQDQEIAMKVAATRNEVSALKRKLDQFDLEKSLRSRAPRRDAKAQGPRRGDDKQCPLAAHGTRRHRSAAP